MIFHHYIFMYALTSFIKIDTSPNDMFFQGSSSLPDFCQSLHIFLGDLLVTSSWLPNDTFLSTWLSFMISSFLHILHSQELTTFLVYFSYTTASYSMRTYYADFICQSTERSFFIDHTSKYGSLLLATI